MNITSVKGQVSDDFSDGNFSSNPEWSGDVSSFKVNQDFRLQLNDVAASTSYLSTSNLMIAETEWQFRVQCNFNPSANNFCRIYLISDRHELTSALKGYYIQLGESGNSDAIALFRQDGEEHSLICRGTEALLANAFDIRIKVTRSGGGKWKIYADPSGNFNFLPEAEGFDGFFTNTTFVGIVCTYTISNSTKFYFDDFYVGNIQYDLSPPEITGVKVIGSGKADIYFNEGLVYEPASKPENFRLQPLNVNPQMAEPDDVDASVVHLYFEEEFSSGNTYQIQAFNMQDYSGNISEESGFEFVNFQPSSASVCINEIMADPSPVVGLPEFEYLELANNTAFEIDLSGWKLQIGNSVKTFDAVCLPSESYLILSKKEAAEAFNPYGNFYGFESFSLTNSAQVVSLLNSDGKVISKVSYNNSWYRDKQKDDGGWSLEQIDQYNPCCGKQNWKASENPFGGSPGKVNSVDQGISQQPFIQRTGYIDDEHIVLYFSQKMDSNSVLNPEAYDVDFGLGKPVAVKCLTNHYDHVVLQLANPMIQGQIYGIQLKDSIYNCAGIPLKDEKFIRAGIPQDVSVNDVVINEILFNPAGEGVDYVEIYNRSDKIIEINRLLLTTVMENFPDPPDTNTALFCLSTALFFPDSYLLLSPGTEIVLEQYHTESPEAFMEINGFPKMNKDKGKVILQTLDNAVIDQMFYKEDMHYPLLNYFDGVSLERIHYNRPSFDESNWQSASSTSGYGTPGFRNSQFVPMTEVKDPVVIEPEIFSPDGDGKGDLLNIQYAFLQAGLTANIIIFDAAGRKVRNLVNNLPVGTSGAFSWNGLDDNGQIVQPGIYVICFEIYSIEGIVDQYKKVAVLAM